MGIFPLKNESGEEVIDSKGKAEILNQQYDQWRMYASKKAWSNQSNRAIFNSNQSIKRSGRLSGPFWHVYSTTLYEQGM